MLTFSLQSGSNGNAIYVEAGDIRLLFDAGISGSRAEQRMADRGRDIRDVDGVLISHQHADHVRGAGIFQRKFGTPVYMTERAYSATASNLGKMDNLRHFKPGESVRFDNVTVYTLPTMHDAPDSVAFVVEHESSRLGILTDLGHAHSGLRTVLESVDAAYLECNYDRHMLEHGSYPAYLKSRIRGPGGHLCNDEAAELLLACGKNRPRWIAAAHLSEENNSASLAVETTRRVVGSDYPVHLAPRYTCSEVLVV